MAWCDGEGARGEGLTDGEGGRRERRKVAIGAVKVWTSSARVPHSWEQQWGRKEQCGEGFAAAMLHRGPEQPLRRTYDSASKIRPCYLLLVVSS